jgi:hypothetical protein
MMFSPYNASTHQAILVLLLHIRSASRPDAFIVCVYCSKMVLYMMTLRQTDARYGLLSFLV